VSGLVSLVGAGPGDPDLLTRKAARRLAEADLVLYDALIDPAMLDLAGRARRFYVGKRAGRHHVTQEQIHRILIREAQAGARVVRLKGGDPFVFGRGGEEALALTEAGIPFRIVPGVSSGLAALAIHGVPATTRTTNHAVILATGHRAEDASMDWGALARTGAPLLLYMAAANLPAIVDGLIAGGLPATTPALAVHAATTDQEQVVEATLGGLPGLVASGAIRSPAVVAIGAIAAYRGRIASHLLGLRAEA